MAKLDKNEVKILITSLTNAQEKISEIATATGSRTKSVKDIYANFQSASVNESLKTVPIEDIALSTEGINIKALKANGIEYLADVSNKTAKDLESINGIGEVMANKIMVAVESSKQSIRDGFRLKIGEKELDDMQIAIMLSDLFFIMKSGDLTKEARDLADSHKFEIRENADRLKRPEVKKLLFFKDSKDQEEREVAYKNLCAVKDTGFVTAVSEIDNRYQELQKQCSKDAAVIEFRRNTAPFFALLEKICGAGAVKADEEIFGLPRDLINKINAFELDTSLMVATLRNYQEFGTKYILNQQKVLLGDEMGLGKTMQAIASIAHLSAKGATHFIVVCPVSVMVNWGREIEKHSKLFTMRIHGDDREKEFDRFIADGGVAVTTYETIVRLPLEKLEHLDMLTVDEAHYVKNPQAQRTQALTKLTAISDYVLLMTGTPLENKVEEMIFLISLLRDNLASELKNMITLNKAPEFRTKIAPAYLRRVRSDVLTELPEKNEVQEFIPLTKVEETMYYQALVERNQMACRKLSYLTEKIEDSSKLTRIKELCEEAKNEGRKIIIFSFFLGILDRVEEALGDRCFGKITGAIPSDERQDIIDRFADSEDGSVILAQIVAGGVGLNIQCASVVIICEPQWKPSIENQAISRCYRMGQSRDVLVYRILSDDTVDEEIVEVLRQKSELFDNYADESEITEVKKSMDDIIEQQRKAYGITEEAPAKNLEVPAPVPTETIAVPQVTPADVSSGTDGVNQ